MKVKKILLVDDSQPFNFLTKQTLKKAIEGCQVDEVLNGQAAIKYLNAAADCPDVILLDLNMPVMDGFEFLREFEKRGKCLNNSKVFILTSSVLEEDKQAALANKYVKGYFDKPLGPEHIEKINASFN